MSGSDSCYAKRDMNQGVDGVPRFAKYTLVAQTCIVEKVCAQSNEHPPSIISGNVVVLLKGFSIG